MLPSRLSTRNKAVVPGGGERLAQDAAESSLQSSCFSPSQHHSFHLAAIFFDSSRHWHPCLHSQDSKLLHRAKSNAIMWLAQDSHPGTARLWALQRPGGDYEKHLLRVRSLSLSYVCKSGWSSVTQDGYREEGLVFPGECHQKGQWGNVGSPLFNHPGRGADSSLSPVQCPLCCAGVGACGCLRMASPGTWGRWW